MKFFLTLFIAIFLSSSVRLLAFQTEAPGFIILKDQTTESGTIDVLDLEDEGTIIFKKNNNPAQRYIASDIIAFSVDGSSLIRSLQIEYSLTSSKDTVESFFAERIFDGLIHLEKVFAASFKYAITKQGNSKALQRIKNENAGIQDSFDQYKGTFYVAFRDCERTIDTNNIYFTEKAFIEILKKYKACKDPDYEYKREKEGWGILVGLGVNRIQLDIEAQHESGTVEERFISNYRESSNFNFNAGVEKKIFKGLFFSVTGSYQKYNFVHNDKENQRAVGSFTYAEISLGGSIDFRLENKYVTPRFGVGYQFHHIDSGLAGPITGELNTNTIYTETKSYKEYLLKPTGIDVNYSTPFFISGLSKDISSMISFGVSLKTVLRNKEYFNADYEKSRDDLSTEFIFSSFIVYRF